LAMKFLQGGAPAAQAQAAGGNSMLNMFLDKNNDGNVDLGDAMGLAMQYMQNR
jgi:hypothetical protein